MTDAEKAEFDKKEADLKALNEKLEAAEKRVEDSQEMIHKQSEEVGEARKGSAEVTKQVAELTAELVKANREVREAQAAILKASEELAELKKAKGPESGEGNTQAKPKTVEELVDSLTPAEQKKLDEAWENADEETRKAIKGDQKLYKSFVSQAKEAVVEEAKSDLSSWRNTPVRESSNTDSTDIEKTVRELFKKQKQSTQYVPPGSNGGNARPKIEQNKRPKRPVHTSLSTW